jgi:acetyl-CoA carboxylase biotin carboxyl carrier protein
MKRAGRLHAPAVEAIASGLELRAPGPGVFVPALGDGDVVAPGGVIGELVVLGRASAVVVPRGAATGAAVRIAAAPHPVGFGERLVEIDPAMQRGGEAVVQAAAATVEGLVFRAPTSGRFYGRSAPDKPAFVEAGTALAPGATVCLLEVMKTFHRVTYGGAGMPEAARVKAVLVKDGDDVNAGDPLISLE